MSENTGLRTREVGPVEQLCKEIGFEWDRRLERADLLVGFVSQLVGEVEHKRHIGIRLAEMGGKAPSKGSAEVLALTVTMLQAVTNEDLIAKAALVHDACHRLNPDDAYPTDHLIDMLSSCASAIRFGLESPCRSRHAAEAANHVWKHMYGVSRFDSHTPAWEKAWARSKLQAAIISLLTPAALQPDTDPKGEIPGQPQNPLTQDGWRAET